MILKALTPVFNNGVIIEEGQRFSCPSDLAKKLIENMAAIEEDIENNTAAEEDLENKDKTEEVLKNNTVSEGKEAELNRADLQGKNKDELLKLAETKGIKNISNSNKKEEIIEALLDESL